VERVGQGARVSVRDCGPGIAPRDLPRVFDRYWRAASAAGGGSGLGLFIAKGIVDAHGGKIWAESRPGAGSTFLFTIPGKEEPSGTTWRDRLRLRRSRR